MANEEHLVILRQGVEFWHQWRKENPGIKPDLSNADLRGINLSNTDLSGALLVGSNLSEVNLNYCDLRDANLSTAVLKGADLNYSDLSGANLSCADLSEANLNRTEFYITRALSTNFSAANFTGACLENWHINTNTNLTNAICDYVYLQQGQQERRPSSGNFESGEFTKLFQKSLKTVDLIFRNGIDWDAFAYSFKKVEVENQGAQLDVQNIEKKGDGVLVVRVAVAADANKAKIHGDFIQGYEFAHKALEAQYEARLEDKDKQITSQFAQINRLINIVEQRGPFQQTIHLQNAQFGGGFVNAETVQSAQIGGDICNTDNLERPESE